MRILTDPIRKCGFFLITRLTSLHCKIKILGKQNIPNTNQVLIVANHSSYLDVFILGVALFHNLINIRWVISKTNYRKWYLQWLYWLNRVIVVNGTIEKAKQALNNNLWVAIFPEGAGKWCAPKNEEKRKPGHGAATIALSTGVTILPIGISGADKVLPANSFKMNRQYGIAVRIGEAFSFEMAQQERIDQALLEKTTQEIMGRINALLGPDKKELN